MERTAQPHANGRKRGHSLCTPDNTPLRTREGVRVLGRWPLLVVYVRPTHSNKDHKAVWTEACCTLHAYSLEWMHTTDKGRPIACDEQRQAFTVYGTPASVLALWENLPKCFSSAHFALSDEVPRAATTLAAAPPVKGKDEVGKAYTPAESAWRNRIKAAMRGKR